MNQTKAADDPFERNEIRVGDRRIRSAHELPGGVVINFHERSTGNRVELSERGTWRGVVIDLASAIDCLVQIGAIRVHFGGLRVSFVANNRRYSTGVTVSVGDGCIFNGSTHIIGPLTSGLSVRLGTDCLLASNVSIRGSSHHGLWDKATGVLLNPEVGIDIGDHVWLGDQVVVLNKAKISAGSVVGARSVVNKPFDEPDVMLAGAPAAIRKHGVEWTNEFPLDNGQTPRTSPA